MTVPGRLVCPLLVGRDELLALAERRRVEAAAGHGGLLLLAGEAGIGKTRLLAAIETRAEVEGAVVARGVAFPRDVDTAGGVLLDLARSLARVPRLAAAGSELRARLEAPGDEGGDAHR